VVQQVGDAELEAVLKVGNLAMVAAGAAGSSGGATGGLVNDARSYAASLPTPQRTPRAAQGSDVVLQEARNQLAMRDLQTPLLGGETPSLLEGTGFAGSAPRGAGAVATPNALAAHGTPLGTPAGTPLLLGGGGGGRAAGGATPLGGSSGGTPLRDDLALNHGGGGGNGGLPPGMSAAAAARLQRSQLALALSNLPEPQYAYEIEVPELPAGHGGEGPEGRAGSALSVEDAADRDARAALAHAAAAAAELARRSAAVRRGLPRPYDAAVAGAALAAAGHGQDGGRRGADALVRAEMASLLAHDGAQFPVDAPDHADKDSKKRAKKARKDAAAAAGPLEDFDDAALADARLLVAAELAADPAAALAYAAAQADASGLGLLWSETQGGFAYLPERQQVASLASASAKERLSSLAFAFEACRGHMAKHADKCAKLEKKLQLRTVGYEDKAAQLRQQCAGAHGQWDKKRIEQGCFEALAAVEAVAAPQRLGDLYDLGKAEAARNGAMQAQYKALLVERDRLTAAFAHAAQAKA
jgi:pre-mRNA-splicing factor CDC5/CEF1